MAAPINRLETIWSRNEARAADAANEHAGWGNRAKSWENKVEGLLAKHPTAAIVAAAAVGIALGWMVKRK
jgi:ElaB/YqjD/DUF883 family membrane-anchored ribosome-binding protein